MNTATITSEEIGVVMAALTAEYGPQEDAKHRVWAQKLTGRDSDCVMRALHATTNTSRYFPQWSDFLAQYQIAQNRKETDRLDPALSHGAGTYPTSVFERLAAVGKATPKLTFDQAKLIFADFVDAWGPCSAETAERWLRGMVTMQADVAADSVDIILNRCSSWPSWTTYSTAGYREALDRRSSARFSVSA